MNGSLIACFSPIRSLSLLTLLLFFAGTLSAQETLTVEQAIEIVLKNNYDIQLAKNEAEIAARNNSVGNAGMLPRINGTLSDNFTLNNLNQAFSNGNEINTNNVTGNNLSAGVALNWTLFDGLRMFAAKGRLKRLEQIGALALKDEMQTVVANTMTAYYDVVRAQQQMKAIDEAIGILEERVKLAEARYQVGTAGKSDWLQARVDLNEQKSNRLMQRKLIEQRKADLNNLLARNAETEFTVTDSIPLLQTENVAADVESKNLQLLLAAKNVEVARFAKKEAFSQYLPTLVGNLGYNYSRANNSAGFFLVNQTNGLNTGFSLNIPLFNGLNTIRQNKVAAIQLLSSQFNLEKVRFQVRASQYKATKDFALAMQQLKLEEENIALAREHSTIALERFRLAQSTAIELREAQISFVNAQTRLVNARYAAKLADTELLRLRGELVR
jgi:outer membrane protein